MHEVKMYGRIAMKKSFITERNRKKRVTRTKKYKNTGNSFWERVIWSDESKFNLIVTDGIVRKWRWLNEDFKSEFVKHTVKHCDGTVMVWGCFSLDTFVFIIRRVFDNFLG